MLTRSAKTRSSRGWALIVILLAVAIGLTIYFIQFGGRLTDDSDQPSKISLEGRLTTMEQTQDLRDTRGGSGEYNESDDDDDGYARD
ncbi:hypothetical protein JXA32_13910 [Candidatus Sumerlaeota bacterium]|nr:hypothetical protein [Candidatus Sumerlaeota bacterium]